MLVMEVKRRNVRVEVVIFFPLYATGFRFLQQLALMEMKKQEPKSRDKAPF
jgi:hypothetical protein